MCVYHSLGVALVSRSICICCYLDLCSKTIWCVRVWNNLFLFRIMRPYVLYLCYESVCD